MFMPFYQQALLLVLTKLLTFLRCTRVTLWEISSVVQSIPGIFFLGGGGGTIMGLIWSFLACNTFSTAGDILGQYKFKMIKAKLGKKLPKSSLATDYSISFPAPSALPTVLMRINEISFS